MFRYAAYFITLNCLWANASTAQNSTTLGPNDTIAVFQFYYNGDSIPGSYLPEVFVYGKLSVQQYQNYKEQEWTRLRNAIYITYPYAKKASIVFKDVNTHLQNITDNTKRRKYIKSRENELKKEFASKIVNLSIYQGKILMKLIYRETGSNCYEIIKELKGSFTASFWQTILFFAGTSLKQNYNPTGADKDIEAIVQEVERMGYR